MGNDGGSIPTRRDLVKTSARARSTADLFQAKQYNHAYLWTACALSDRPLGADPIVCDYRGRLYDKAAVIELLLERAKGKDEKADPVPHIVSLKDVVDVHFSTASTPPPDLPEDEKDNKEKIPGGDVPATWICPASQKPVLQESAGAKFVCLVPCGHVLADSALRELRGDTTTTDNNAETSCFVCGAAVDPALGVVTLNPAAAADVAAAEARRATLAARGLTHSLKPLKKSKSKKKESKKRSADSGKDVAASHKKKQKVET